MEFRNSGRLEDQIVQNQFTAYLRIAVRRKVKDVLNKRKKWRQTEILTDFQEIGPWEWQRAIRTQDPAEVFAELEALKALLAELSSRDRGIFLGRALYGWDFEMLGRAYGLTYQGTAAVYHRVLRRLRQVLGRECT